LESDATAFLSAATTRSVPVATAITAPAAAAAATVAAAAAITAPAAATATAAAAAAATTTVAAAITTVSAATTATATEAAAATTAGRAFFTGTSDVHRQGAATEVLAVEKIHSLLRLVGRAEFNESKPAGFARELVEHEVDTGHHSSSAEMILDVALHGLVRQIAHKEPRIIVHN
jgi:hypothetical protein